MNTTTKKLLSLLVVFAMVLSMAPSFTLPVFATSGSTEDDSTETPEIVYGGYYMPEDLAATHQEKVNKATEVRNAYPALKEALQAGTTTYTCPMCGTVNAVWTEIGSNGKVLWTGNKTDTGKYHYFINGAVGSAEEPKFNGNIAQSTGSATMCFALLDAEAYVQTRFHVSGNSTFNFMGEGFISTGGHTDYANCGLFTVNPNTTQKPTLNLYGGTYMSTTYANTTVGKTYGANTAQGVGVIHNSAAGAGATINMFDGVVIGQTVAEGATLDTSYEQYNAYIAGTFNMYGGTIQNGVSDSDYGSVSVIANGTFNMFGGTIQGATGKTSSTNYSGNVVNYGKFNMYGGTITGGKAIDGGNIEVASSSVTNIDGRALVTLGTASSGGNIGTLNATADKGATAKVYIKGGKVSDGTATATGNFGGGNLYGYGGAQFEISGGIVTGGSAVNGGNIHIRNGGSKVTVTGTGSVTYGNATGDGGNIRAFNNADVVVSGGTISNGTADGKGGNIFATTNRVTVTVSGGSVHTGSAAQGGNIYGVTSNTESYIKVSGGSVYGGTATGNGGNIRTESIPVIMESGSVYGGVCGTTTDTASGGNFFLWGSLTATGGSIYGGDSPNTGGNIWMQNGTVDLTNTAVYDGSAKHGSNINIAEGGVLNIRVGASIYGGTIKSGGSQGNGVRITKGTVNMTGGEIRPGDKDSVWLINSTMNMSGGTVITKDSTAMYNAGIKVVPDGENGTGTLYLSGDASVTSADGSYTGAQIGLYGTTTKLIIDPSWIGCASVAYNSVALSNGKVPVANGYVGTTTAQNLSGTFTGTLNYADVETGETIGFLRGVSGELVYDTDFDPAGNNGEAYCLACKATVTWTPYADMSKGTTHTAGHYYLADNATYSDEGFMVGGSACFHTNGFTLSPDSTGTLALFATGTLNIMGDGTVIGGTKGAIYLNGGKASSKTNVYGGTFKSNNENAPVAWVYENGGTLNFYDGTIDAAGANNATCIDGRLYNAETTPNGGPAVFNMYGGKIINGDSWLRTEYATFNVYGGTIDGYVGAGKVSSLTGTIDNVNAGTGYTKYIVDGKAVVANASVASFGEGYLLAGVGEDAGEMRLNAPIGTFSGVKTLKVEVYDASGNLIVTTTPTEACVNNYILTSTLSQISTMLAGTSGSWSSTWEDGQPSDATVPASMKLYVNDMSVPIFLCGVNGFGNQTITDADWVAALNGTNNAAIIVNNGNVTGMFVTLAEAIAAAGQGDTIVLYQPVVANEYIKLTKDISIDLGAQNAFYADINGNTLTLAGTGKLYAVDTANDNYQLTDGLVSAADAIDVAMDLTVDGKRYIGLEEPDGISFHRLEVGVAYVSLRTTEAGLYYKAKYKCDTDLASAAIAYGVVISVDNMPGADFAEETQDINKITKIFTVDQPLTSDLVVTSGSVFGIMKTDGRTFAQNAAYGKVKIYANPYLELPNGRIVMCDTTNAGKVATDADFTGIAYSLYDTMKAIDNKWNDAKVATPAVKNAIKAFYDEWAAYGMSDWATDLSNIVNHTVS